MKPEIFQFEHPDMGTPLDATIAFDYVLRYANGREWEDIYPYIEAVYVGNIDIMPLLSHYLLNDIMKAYKESKIEQD